VIGVILFATGIFFKKMKIIIKPRHGGKPTELIRLADKNDGYIVCTNRMDVHRVVERAQSMGCSINFPITFDEFLSHQYYGKGIRKFFIDNVDILLESLSHAPIEAISISE
jgi:hypothetical protein